jgi:phage-related holin
MKQKIIEIEADWMGVSQQIRNLILIGYHIDAVISEDNNANRNLTRYYIIVTKPKFESENH